MVTGEAAAYAPANHPCPIGQFPVGQVGKLIKSMLKAAGPEQLSPGAE
jgi:hypothetical protein